MWQGSAGAGRLDSGHERHALFWLR
jgi:hypothetical protein